MSAEMSVVLCMRCMRRLGASPVCSYCGYDNRATQSEPFLPIKTVLAGRYLVGAVCGMNGEGVTYVGFDLSQRAPVYIREFFPKSFAMRASDGRLVNVSQGAEALFSRYYNEFVGLWRRLAQLRNFGALLPVYDIFEENGTAYSISEYVYGKTLRDFLLDNPSGIVTWEECRRLFMPLLSTLSTLHSYSIVHGGISPTTIIVDDSGKLRLAGFSITSIRITSGFLESELFPGYAAIEQYNSNGRLGPWTDIYSAAATMYRSLTGTTPPEATSRAVNDRLIIPSRIAETLPSYAMNALGNALRILSRDRTQSIEQFREELSAAPSVTIGRQVQKEIYSSPRRPAFDPSFVQPVQPVYMQQPQTATQSQSYQPSANQQRPAPQTMQQPQTVNKTTPKAAIVALVVLILMIAMLIVLFLVKGNIIGGGTDETEPSVTETTTEADSDAITVIPNMVGETYDSMVTYYDGIFTIVVSSEEYSDEFSRGIIIRQDANAGDPITDDLVITVTISKGVEQVRLDDVRGLDKSLAKSKLEAAGFVVDFITIYNDGSSSEGNVAQMDLEPYMDYPKGTLVTLQVYDAPPTTSAQ